MMIYFPDIIIIIINPTMCVHNWKYNNKPKTSHTSCNRLEMKLDCNLMYCIVIYSDSVKC